VSRTSLVTLLLVASGLLLPFALVGLWTQQVLLDRERFTNLSDDLLNHEAVRRGIADAVVTDIGRTQPLPAASELVIRAGIAGALDTPAYRAVFKQSLGGVHDQLTSDEDTITLDVQPGVNLARAQNPQVARALGGTQLPPIVIARRSQVPILWGAVDGAQRVALITPLVVLVLLALAVAYVLSGIVIRVGGVVRRIYRSFAGRPPAAPLLPRPGGQPRRLRPHRAPRSEYRRRARRARSSP